MLSRTISTLQQAGISHFHVGVGWKGELIREYISSHFDTSVTVVDVPNYSVGPLQTFVTTTQGLTDELLFVVPADYMFTPDICEILINAHTEQSIEPILTLGVSEVGTGSMIFGDGAGNMLGLNTAIGNAIKVGHSAMALVAGPEFLRLSRACLANGMTHLSQVIVHAMEEGHSVRYADVPDTWTEIDTPCDVLRAANFVMINSLFSRDAGLFVPQGDIFEFGAPITMPNGITLADGVTITGPTFVSHGCALETTCNIGPNVLVEPNAVIGRGTTLRDAYIAENASTHESSELHRVVVFGDYSIRIGDGHAE